MFSSRHACPECGFAVPLLEPRMFSFNNPAGACPTCNGLGVEEFFDPERVVAHPHLSLAGGAIRGWDRRNAQYFQTIQSLARHFHFDLETPWSELDEPVRKLLLYGSGTEEIDFRFEDSRGSAHRKPPCLRGRRAEPRAALSRDGFGGGARGARASSAARAPAPSATDHA